MAREVQVWDLGESVNFTHTAALYIGKIILRMAIYTILVRTGDEGLST